MKAGTHIIGGYVFAGTLCSFTDVNVFENEYYILSCAVFSILPDIDTTKSLIGKVFYPISWILYRKLGHRTITHSLLFLLFVWLVLFLLLKFGIIADSNYLKIALFSLIGHFVFDMITESGIPLLFPFFKNACVIPANPHYRFKSGEVKSEIVIMGVCGLLCFTLQPLFSQGFWTSYNRQFGTVKHVDRENKNTEFYIVCDYDYILNSVNYRGEAIVLDSKTNELILFDNERVFTLNSDDAQLKINYTKPRISTIPKRFEELLFYTISYDSLQSLLNGRLASGLIQSNKNVKYIDNAITYHTNYIKFANSFNFQIFADYDTTKLSVRTSISRLESSINQVYQRYNEELNKYKRHFSQINNLENSLLSDTLSLYERNKLQRELIRLRNRTVEEPVLHSPTSQLAELEIHRSSLNDNDLSFSGNMIIYLFGEVINEDNTTIPNYNALHLFASFNQSQNP